MATKPSSSRSPSIRFIEDSLIVPTQNASLFAATFLLIFAHTFVFIAVAIYIAHPLCASIVLDIDALKSTDPASYDYSVEVDTTREHAKKLFLMYLAYLASKLTTQLVTARATSTTYSHEHVTRKVVKKRIGGVLVTAAFIGVLELTSTALLVVILVSSWAYAETSMASTCGHLLFLIALLLYIYFGTILPVSLAVSAVDDGSHSVWALRRAWRVMRARRKESAVLVLVASVLPAVMYPVPMYAFSSVYSAETFALYSARNEDVWLLGVVSGFLLPSVGAQLFSMVAATVFYCQFRETNEGVCTSD